MSRSNISFRMYEFWLLLDESLLLSEVGGDMILTFLLPHSSIFLKICHSSEQFDGKFSFWWDFQEDIMIAKLKQTYKILSHISQSAELSVLLLFIYIWTYRISSVVIFRLSYIFSFYSLWFFANGATKISPTKYAGGSRGLFAAINCIILSCILQAPFVHILSKFAWSATEYSLGR